MNVNIILFDEFETMDAFVPAQIFGMAPEHFYLQYFSVNGGIVTSSQGAKVWTEILIPEEMEDILVIPGGKGAKRLIYLEPKTVNLMKEAVRNVSYCLMVSNGSALISQTGELYRRTITDYAYDENWKRMFSAEIRRVSGVRWLEDGKFYSCSATAYAIDMALGAVEDVVDLDVAEKIAARMGYDWDSGSREGDSLYK
ncbi:MAG: DJ-1/PfpI family protein [Lachnospiraceae bacterium]|nr:DJ-1/PfpI family protein [Lachnospiraceae bacterium]